MVTQAQASAQNARTLTRIAGIPRRVGREFTSLFKLWSGTQLVDVNRQFLGRPGLIPRSGHLRSTFAARLSGAGSLNGLAAEVYSQGSGRATLTGQGYARLQEFGGTIRPKRARMLTIPTDLNFGPNGLPKYRSASALRAQGRTLMVRTKRGQWLIMVKEGGEYRPMWMLRRAVTIPPRLRFYDSFRDRKGERGPQIMRAAGNAIKAGK